MDTQSNREEYYDNQQSQTALEDWEPNDKNAPRHRLFRHGDVVHAFLEGLLGRTTLTYCMEKTVLIFKHCLFTLVLLPAASQKEASWVDDSEELFHIKNWRIEQKIGPCLTVTIDSSHRCTF